MPEPPDFEKLALAAIDASFDDPSHVFSFPTDVQRCQRAIVEQLCLVWNARGAADLEAKHSAFRVDVGLGGALADLEDEAIRKLDR